MSVLLRVYAKCVAGQEQATLNRIQRAMDAMTNDGETSDSTNDQDQRTPGEGPDSADDQDQYGKPEG